MIFGFAVYRSHSNIDFLKLSILTNFQQVVKISRRSDGGKSTKMSFKNVRYGSQKTVSNTPNSKMAANGDDLERVT